MLFIYHSRFLGSQIPNLNLRRDLGFFGERDLSFWPCCLQNPRQLILDQHRAIHWKVNGPINYNHSNQGASKLVAWICYMCTTGNGIFHSTLHQRLGFQFLDMIQMDHKLGLGIWWNIGALWVMIISSSTSCVMSA